MTTWQKLQIVAGIALLVPTFWITFFLITGLDRENDAREGHKNKRSSGDEG